MSEEFTTIKITKSLNKELDVICDFAKITKTDFMKRVVHPTFMAFRPEVFKSVKTGDYIGFDFEVKAYPKIDLITGSYPVEINTPNSETDELTFNLVTEAFKSLDDQKELNKVKFANSIKALLNND